MIAYSPARLALVPLVPQRSRALGQIRPASADIPLLVGASAVGLALSAAAAWVGIRAGLREKGLLSVAGWAVGVAGALRGVLGLSGLLLLATGAAGSQTTQETPPSQLV